MMIIIENKVEITDLIPLILNMNVRLNWAMITEVIEYKVADSRVGLIQNIELREVKIIIFNIINKLVDGKYELNT